MSRFERGQTIQLHGNTSRLRQLIKDHGITWRVNQSECHMPCFAGKLGVRIDSLDGKHTRNVQISDINSL